jgi:hypothetical protein
MQSFDNLDPVAGVAEPLPAPTTTVRPFGRGDRLTTILLPDRQQRPPLKSEVENGRRSSADNQYHSSAGP